MKKRKALKIPYKIAVKPRALVPYFTYLLSNRFIWHYYNKEIS